jgi:hypothetical protein
MIKLYHGDIKKNKVDAIVNAANTSLVGRGGVALTGACTVALLLNIHQDKDFVRTNAHPVRILQNISILALLAAKKICLCFLLLRLLLHQPL